MINYYKTLRINSTATLEEIRHSFRILAHQYHPDKTNGDKSSSDMFVEIKEAYDTLSDTHKRQQYDSVFKQYYNNYYSEYENTETESEVVNIEEINFIFFELKKFKADNYENISLEALQESLISCKAKLTTLKQSNVIKYDSYLDTSSTVVRNALEIAERILNNLIQNCILTPDDLFKKIPPVARIQAVLNWLEDIIKCVISTLENFDMNQTTKEIYSLKKQYYLELKNDFNKKTSEKESGKGCYIATMVYGDYNHHNVLVLRYYRDHILEKKIFGKQLIKLYYLISPHLVSFLKGHRFANKVIRQFLNHQVNRIKSKY